MDENGRDNKGPGVRGNYYENYAAYCSPTSRQILIGVNKEMFRMGREWHEGKSRNDLSMSNEHENEPLMPPSYPINCVLLEDFWFKYFRLDRKGRQIISDVVRRLISEGRVHLHEGMLWEAVANFICHLNRVSLRAESVKYSICVGDTISYGPDSKNYYNQMHYAFNRAVLPKHSKPMLRCFCAYNLITPEILTTGCGFLYRFNLRNWPPSDKTRRQLELFSIEAVHQKLLENPNISLDEIIFQITGIPRSSFDKYEIRVAFTKYIADEKTLSLLTDLLDSLLDN